MVSTGPRYLPTITRYEDVKERAVPKAETSSREIHTLFSLFSKLNNFMFVWRRWSDWVLHIE